MFKKYLCLILVCSMLIVSVASVNATHLWPSPIKFYTSNPKYCISNSFSSTYKTAIENAAIYLNGQPTKFTLTKINYDSNCFNHIFPGSISPNYLAISRIYLSTPTTINHVDVTVNTYYQFAGSNCGPPYNLKWTMHHEFGHWIPMKHPSSSSEDTVMVANYDCSKWNSYKSHDRSTMVAVYG